MPDTVARDCIERMLASSTWSDFGYKVQALAAHVLLRLGYQVTECNQRGHPDLTAFWEGREFRFEVEAEVTGPRLRQLTKADFDSLMATHHGYYALAISFPTPRWILVPASKLVSRTNPSPNRVMEALSDKEYSAAWTRAYIELLRDSHRKIRRASFSDLSEWALAGIGL